MAKRYLRGSALAAIDIRITGLDQEMGHHILQLAIVPLDHQFLPSSDLDPCSIYIRPRVQVGGGAVRNAVGCLPVCEYGYSQTDARVALLNWWERLRLDCRLIPICLRYNIIASFLREEFSEPLIDLIFDFDRARSLATIAGFVQDFYSFQQPMTDLPIQDPSLPALARKLHVPIRNPGEAVSHAMAVAGVYRGLMDPSNALGLVARSTALSDVILGEMTDLTDLSIAAYGIADAELARRNLQSLAGGSYSQPQPVDDEEEEGDLIDNWP